jgi:dTDP-4-dehydrorhamnose 3,5-epimerase-like enzyme
MANELIASTRSDNRGTLTVIDKLLPFAVKRVFYIYDCSEIPRGGHRHKTNRQALVCVHGSCVVEWTNGWESGEVLLEKPDHVLIIEPEDWHVMRNFSKDAVLLVLASESYDPDDYIFEGYPR